MFTVTRVHFGNGSRFFIRFGLLLTISGPYLASGRDHSVEQCYRMANDEHDMFRRAQNRTFRGFEKEQNMVWKGPFRFIQAADTQYGLIDELTHVNWDGPIDAAVAASKKYKAAGESVWKEEIRLTELAISQWNRMLPKPRFVVICGDLVNDYPGEAHRFDQVADFKATFSELDHSIPLVLLPGNHDLLDRPTVAAVESYKRTFGDDYFSFWVDGVMFIVINVQYNKNKTYVEQLADEHERWIEERLQEVIAERERYKHVIVFQHIPWFLRDIEEPDDDIFNIAIDERKRMIYKFSNAGIRAIFAGHYHRNAGGRYEDLELVVTSAMGAVMKDPITGIIEKSGYRIVNVQEDMIKHEFVEIEA